MIYFVQTEFYSMNHLIERNFRYKKISRAVAKYQWSKTPLSKFPQEIEDLQEIMLKECG